MREISPSAPRAQAGAVNVMWLVVIMILWIATLGAFYFQTSEIARANEAQAAANADKAVMEQKFETLFTEKRELAKVLGYSNAEDTEIDQAALRSDIESAKTSLGAALGGPDTQVTLEQSIKVALATLTSARAAQAKAEADFAAEAAARKAADKATADVRTQMQSQIDTLRSDLRNEQQRSQSTAQNDKSRHDELIAANKEADQALRDAQDKVTELQAQLERERTMSEQELSAVKMRRQPPEPDQPDGRVLAVSEDGSVAWIDVGGKNGLRLGTRFDLLRRSRSGELVSRGTVEVKEVDSDMAMVGLLGNVDPLDPMLAGDLVRNPLFDRNAKLNFAFLGDFPASMSREFVTGRLKELGAGVTDKVTTSTDVLVLGEPSLAEGEDAPDLTESDEYVLADKLGLRIIRLADLARFLRY